MMTRKLLSPEMLYAVFFVTPFLFTFIPFVSGVISLEFRTITFIAFSVLSFYLGCFLARFIRKIIIANGFFLKKVDIIYGGTRLYGVVNKPGRALFGFLFILAFLGAGFLFLEFYFLGGIPIFMNDLETLRLNIKINGYIHLLAINTGFVGALSLIAFVSRRADPRFFAKKYLYLGIFCIILILLTGNRSDIFIPIVVFFSYLMLSGRLSVDWKVLSIFVSLVILLGVIKHYREIAAGGDDYIEMISGQLDGSLDWWTIIAYPIYMTFTYNFEILQRLMNAGEFELSGGVFTFYSLYSLMPGEQMSFGEYKNNILGVHFYSGLTSTYLSNFFVDFGYWFAVFLSGVLGFIFYLAYSCSRCMNFKALMVYSVLVPRIILCFYVYPFEQFNSIFQIFIAYIFASLAWKRSYV